MDVKNSNMGSYLQHINLIQSLNVSKLDDSHINFIEDLILKDLHTACIQNIYPLILPLALSWAEYDSPAKLKLLSCKILGETISNVEDTLVLQRHVLPITQYLLQDTNPQVRSAICKQLPNLFYKVDKFSENLLLTSLMDAAQDTSTLVKSSVLDVLIESEPFIFKGYIKELVVPTLKQLIQHCFTSPDGFLIHVSKVYSRLCNTYKEYMELEDQAWFISQYSKLCQAGTEDISTFCASSLIHMMLFAKLNSSLCHLLVSCMLEMCTSRFISVKQILSSTLHEIVKSCEEKSRTMLLDVLTVLIQEKVEVVTSLIPNLFSIISLALKHNSKPILFPEKLYLSLKVCEDNISKSHKWRFHVLFFQEILRLADVFSSIVIFDHFQDILFYRIKKCRPLPSRLGACKTLLLLMDKTNKGDIASRCFARLHKDLNESKSFYDRNLFVKICQQAVQIITLPEFNKHLLPSLLTLASDPVANIRYSVSSILIHVNIRLMSGPADHEWCIRVDQCLEKLKNDPDNDVKHNVLSWESKLKEKRASALLNLLIEPNLIDNDDLLKSESTELNVNQIAHRAVIIHPYMKASIEKEFLIDAGVPLDSTMNDDFQNNIHENINCVQGMNYPYDNKINETNNLNEVRSTSDVENINQISATQIPNGTILVHNINMKDAKVRNINETVNILDKINERVPKSKLVTPKILLKSDKNINNIPFSNDINSFDKRIETILNDGEQPVQIDPNVQIEIKDSSSTNQINHQSTNINNSFSNETKYQKQKQKPKINKDNQPNNFYISNKTKLQKTIFSSLTKNHPTKPIHNDNAMEVEVASSINNHNADVTLNPKCESRVAYMNQKTNNTQENNNSDPNNNHHNNNANKALDSRHSTFSKTMKIPSLLTSKKVNVDNTPNQNYRDSNFLENVENFNKTTPNSFDLNMNQQNGKRQSIHVMESLLSNAISGSKKQDEIEARENTVHQVKENFIMRNPNLTVNDRRFIPNFQNKRKSMYQPSDRDMFSKLYKEQALKYQQSKMESKDTIENILPTKDTLDTKENRTTNNVGAQISNTIPRVQKSVQDIENSPSEINSFMSSGNDNTNTTVTFHIKNGLEASVVNSGLSRTPYKEVLVENECHSPPNIELKSLLEDNSSGTYVPLEQSSNLIPLQDKNLEDILKAPKINHVDLKNNEIRFFKTNTNCSDVEIKQVGVQDKHSSSEPLNEPLNVNRRSRWGSLKELDQSVERQPSQEVSKHPPYSRSQHQRELRLDSSNLTVATHPHQSVHLQNSVILHQNQPKQNETEVINSNYTELIHNEAQATKPLLPSKPQSVVGNTLKPLCNQDTNKVLQTNQNENDITQTILNLTNEVESIDQYLNLDVGAKTQKTITLETNQCNTNDQPTFFHSNNNNIVKLRENRRKKHNVSFAPNKIISSEECHRLSAEFEKELLELNSKIEEINEEIRIETLNLITVQQNESNEPKTPTENKPSVQNGYPTFKPAGAFPPISTSSDYVDMSRNNKMKERNESSYVQMKCVGNTSESITYTDHHQETESLKFDNGIVMNSNLEINGDMCAEESQQISNETIGDLCEKRKSFMESKLLKRHVYRRSYDERINKNGFNNIPGTSFIKHSSYRRSFDEKKYGLPNENIVKTLPPKIPVGDYSVNSTNQTPIGGARKTSSYQIFSDRRTVILENKSFTVRIASQNCDKREGAIATERNLNDSPIKGVVDTSRGKTSNGKIEHVSLASSNKNVAKPKQESVVLNGNRFKRDQSVEKDAASLKTTLIGKPRVSVSPLKYNVAWRVSSSPEHSDIRVNKCAETIISNMQIQIPIKGNTIGNLRNRSLSPQNQDDRYKSNNEIESKSNVPELQLTSTNVPLLPTRAANVPEIQPRSSNVPELQLRSSSRMQSPRSISQIIENQIQIPLVDQSERKETISEGTARSYLKSDVKSTNHGILQRYTTSLKSNKLADESRLDIVLGNKAMAKSTAKVNFENTNVILNKADENFRRNIKPNGLPNNNEVLIDIKKITSTPVVSVKKIGTSDRNAKSLQSPGTTMIYNRQNKRNAEQIYESRKSSDEKLNELNKCYTPSSTMVKKSSEMFTKSLRTRPISPANSNSNESLHKKDCPETVEDSSKIPNKKNIKTIKFSCLRSEQESNMNKSMHSEERPRSCIIPNTSYGKVSPNVKSISEENLQQNNRRSSNASVSSMTSTSISKLPRRSIKF